MDGIADLLTEARAAGLQIHAEADRLLIRGPRTQEPLARQLLAQKSQVLTLLAEEVAEVAWRINAMRPQVPACGPIPVLMARACTPTPTRCISCGDPIPAHRRYRCEPCARATWAVLHHVREAVPS